MQGGNSQARNVGSVSHIRARPTMHKGDFFIQSHLWREQSSSLVRGQGSVHPGTRLREQRLSDCPANKNNADSTPYALTTARKKLIHTRNRSFHACREICIH